MSEFIAEFVAAMYSDGFEPKGKVIADDKWHPAYYNGEKRVSGTYALKIVDNNFAIGCYFTRKDPDNKHNWCLANDKKASPAERKKINKKIESEKHRRELEQETKQRRISYLLSKVYKNLPKAASHPYLEKKNIQAHNIKIRAKHNELIIPLYGSDGKIWSVQKINAKGGKYLFSGGRKQGSYFPLCSSKDNLSVILVCEGFATGASIKQATNLPVIVAVDSGNLKPVLLALKIKYPESKFVICADNDAFTKNPKGEPWNVGIESAHKAAQAVGGAYVTAPSFDNIESEPTDFNDLHAIAGLEEVKAQIMQVVDNIPAQQDEGAGIDETQYSDQHDTGTGSYEPNYQEPANTNDLGDFGMNYKVLGYNEGTYYYFPFKERQIIALTATQHNMANLRSIDHYICWMQKFGGSDATTERKVVTHCTNALMELAQNRGVFREEDRVRGCGAWVDNGRKILHCGDVLYVNGVETKFHELQSDYTYIAAVKLLRPANTALSSREANVLRQICEEITWENKLSGSLVAGWLVIAPICGALNFRPHIYITGEAESGKSTVMDLIIKPVLGRISVNVDGATTEPKIREIIGYGARPVVFDEAEKSLNFEAVLGLARLSSTGGTVGKFGQKIFKARSAFCFSAVNPPVNKTSDESRISFMVIKKNRRPTAMQEYNKLVDLIEETLTPEYSARLLTRTLENLDALFENIKVFQRAARTIIKSARAAQVVGTMLAGLYLLSKTDVVTSAFAEEWIAKHDWTSHTMVDEETDPTRLLQYLSSCILRIPHKGHPKEYSIGDLINMAKTGDEDASKHLRYHGIAVKNGRVHIAGRSQHIARLLKDTDWSVKWTRMLSNLEGAEPFRMFYFSVGCKTSGVSLPVETFRDESVYGYKEPELQVDIDCESEEIPFDV